MVNSLRLSYVAKGAKEKVDCSLSLSSENNTNSFNFVCTKFVFRLVLKDVVDLEEFHNFLAGKEKRINLYCSLERGAERYTGERKVIAKNGNIAVSLGACRLEFDEDARIKLLQVIKSIKARPG